MAERDADRARPERLRRQAIAALTGDITSSDVTCSVHGPTHPMTVGERSVAVRAIAAMDSFGRLLSEPSGTATIRREAREIDASATDAAAQKLVRLVRQHDREWSAFVDSIPEPSWFRQMVAQL
jgi:hypothetical protein